MNMSFAEQFFKVNGDYVLDWVGEPKYKWEIIDEHFKKNVRAFFGEHTEWANLYIKLREHNKVNEEPFQLPIEMIEYMILNDSYTRFYVKPVQVIKAK